MDKNRAGFSDPADVNVGNIKEAVCVDAMRVYDSCSRQHDTGYEPPEDALTGRHTFEVEKITEVHCENDFDIGRR